MAQPLPVQSDIVMTAPELSGEDSSVFTYFIPIAAARTGQNVFPDTVYTEAVSLLTAHLMTMRRRRGDGGPVTEKHAGQEGISYGTFNRQSALIQTSYGVEYLQLIRSFIVTPMVT